MARSNSLFTHTFTIDSISYRGVPVASPVANEFDYIGTYLGLGRLPEERNDAYKRRLLDVYVHRANSSYTGLVNGITRELGLNFFKPVEITLRDGIDPSWFPRIEFVDNIVYIWKDIFTKELDISINRGDQKQSTYFMTGLVDAINSSSVFDAVLLDPAYAYKRSDTIINQSSSVLIGAQSLLPTKVNHLGQLNIDKGSVVFSDINTFRTEVASKNLVNSFGKYFIDYSLGVIHSFNIPFDGSNIQYSYRTDPFKPSASPVIIRSIHSTEFQQVLFDQLPQPDNETVSAVPTDKGASIINELLSVVPMYWGE
jgi:hypothetical protein